MLSVPALSQLPLLKNGCEVTSLAMLLGAAHQHVSALELALQQPTDPEPPVFKPADGQFSHIVRWGDPNDGFVGQVTGYGYGIYHAPLARLLNQTLPGRAVDLTGQPLERILAHVASGIPVILWVTTTLKPTDNWTTWTGPHGPVRATIFEHAALLVGYDAAHLYINNPLTGSQLQPVARGPLLAAWKQLGQQALTYTVDVPLAAAAPLSGSSPEAG